MGVSIYMRITEVQSNKEAYETFVLEARKYGSLGIVVDSEASYQKALKIDRNLELCMELSQLYLENNMKNQLFNWAESLVDQFPQEPKVYENLIQLNKEYGKYEECFRVYQLAKKKEALSNSIEELMGNIEYSYKIEGGGYEELSLYVGGYCAVYDGEAWGYVSELGNMIRPCKYSYAGGYATNSYAPIQDGDGEWYYIDKEGNKRLVVQQLKNCTYLGIYAEEVLVASDGTSYSYYNAEFDKQSGDYVYASNMNGGVAAIQEESGWSLINSSYTVITKQRYESMIVDELHYSYKGGRAFGYRNGRYYMLDGEGNEVDTVSIQNAKLFNGGDYAAVQVDGKWGFIDKKGGITIEAQYEDARSFRNGFAAVKQGGKWGFIDERGKVVIEFQFEDAHDFTSRGCVFVKEYGQWTVLKLYKYND